MRRLILASALTLTACYVPLTDFTEVNDAPLAACPADYVQISGTPPDNRYRFVELNRAWDENERDCEDDSTVGTHLVILDDAAESVAVINYLQGETNGFFSHAGYARNLGDNGTTGFFKVTGEPFPPGVFPWGTGQPDTDGPITYFSQLTGIQDAAVTFTTYGMCECDRKPATLTFDIR